MHLEDEIDKVLERGRGIELIHYKMRQELSSVDIGPWERHFAAVHLLYILCDQLAKGTAEESMVQEILEAYTQFGKPYHQEPHPKFD